MKAIIILATLLLTGCASYKHLYETDKRIDAVETKQAQLVGSANQLFNQHRVRIEALEAKVKEEAPEITKAEE